MLTIFDFEPTTQEIEEIGFNYLTMALRLGQSVESPTKNFYLQNIKEKWAMFDIAVLLSERGRQEEANVYFSQIPEIAEEYLLGFDTEAISS